MELQQEREATREGDRRRMEKHPQRSQTDEAHAAGEDADRPTRTRWMLEKDKRELQLRCRPCRIPSLQRRTSKHSRLWANPVTKTTFCSLTGPPARRPLSLHDSVWLPRLKITSRCHNCHRNR
ncbi:hypothetical protein VTN00DRAFT_8791 [Thermoascus crustaceus]|uniref:uncharacterized protein n=1 Tax=Thermoascus crustaceus TaxID=5088 RepID=UPI003743D04E